jgi:hypothetical protein
MENAYSNSRIHLTDDFKSQKTLCRSYVLGQWLTRATNTRDLHKPKCEMCFTVAELRSNDNE